MTDTTSTRDQQREATRRRLREAALAEFARVGAAAAEIGTIAKDAGVSRGSFYFHFPTKEHVLIDLLSEEQIDLAAAVRATDPTAPNAIRRLLDQLEHAVRELEDRLGPTLTHDLFATFLSPPEVEGVYDPVNHPVFLAVLDYVVEAQQAGMARDDVDAIAISLQVLAGLFGSILVRSFLRSTPDAADLSPLATFRVLMAEGVEPR